MEKRGKEALQIPSPVRCDSFGTRAIPECWGYGCYAGDLKLIGPQCAPCYERHDRELKWSRACSLSCLFFFFLFPYCAVPFTSPFPFFSLTFFLPSHLLLLLLLTNLPFCDPVS
ncbi:uncharacterized protein BDW47DRAFT_20241 [Aspergillus candidus]|uniref:Uncharacterized protein n=1 Tax=Aspergillus candidus TaxID=41067 RepID=A0A2I2FDW9_ASPCN|nr:hypothetical protein BDW47DRAFT_20241 [Aspergillus candidus]PLB38814.1 hypothetical protein BDW47DRAFT_20241 [Aspergillus candidus]